MEKYIYYFGGVIIGTAITFYYLKRDESYYKLLYEDILEESDNEDVHSHIVQAQGVQCEITNPTL
jgi:hypothetical protein